MIVSMWMTKNPVTVSLQTPIAEAAALMSRRRIRRLPVMESPNGFALAGILSATDILRAFPPDVNPLAMPLNGDGKHRVVEDIMHRNPVHHRAGRTGRRGGTCDGRAEDRLTAGAA